MADAPLAVVAEQIRRMAGDRALLDATDGQLLECFVASRDEGAFAVLLQRHGAMVHGVARRVLGRTADADDVFQATFLVLVRNARSVRKREAVGSWLHGVASRLALRARAQRARQRNLESRAAAMRKTEPNLQEAWRELQPVLDEEVARLPEKYRLALVLCYLEGKTHEEIARQLACPLGTIRSRVARARALLQKRLTRRGLALSAGSFVALVAGNLAPAAVSGKLLDQTLQVAAARAPGTVSASVAALVNSIVLGKKLKLATRLLGLCCLMAGASLFAYQGVARRLPSVVPDVPPGRPGVARPEPARTDRFGDPLPPGAIQRLGTIRFRPGGQIHALAISPDGKSVVSGGLGTIRFWDLPTGRPGPALLGHGAHVFSVAFARDGKRLVSAGHEDLRSAQDGQGRNEGKLIIWDLATRKAVVTVRHPGWVRCCAIAPDGQRVAMSCDDGTLDVLDAATGKVLHHLGKEHRFNNTVAFSPDSRLIAGAGDNQVIQIWDATTGKGHLRLAGTGFLRTLAFAPGGKSLATAHDDPVNTPIARPPNAPRAATVCLWDLATGQKRHTLHGHKENVFALAFSPDGKHLASAGMQGTVLLWEVASGKQVRTFRDSDSQSWMYGVAFTPDGRSLVAGGSGGQISVWDPATGKRRGAAEEQTAGLACRAVSDDGKTVAASSRGQAITLWDVDSGRQTAVLPTDNHSVYSLAFASGAKRLASAGNDGAVRLWDLTTGREERCWKAPEASWDSRTTFSPTGKLLAAAQVGLIRLLDPVTGKELRRLTGHNGYVIALAFSPDERLLASAAHAYGGANDSKSHDDWSVRVWSLTRGIELQRFQHLYPDQPAFHPDGRLVAYLSQGRLYCRHALTGRQQPTVADTDITAFTFSPDGHWLATAHGHGLIRVRDQATGQDVLRFDATPAAVWQLFWTGDGRRLISANQDWTALVWDLSPPGWQRSARPGGSESPEQAWNDLKAADGGRAYRAVWALAAAGETAVALLEKRLEPAADGGRGKQIRRLVADLDADSFATREAASRQLTAFGAAAESALADALSRSTSLEVRTRAEALLKRMAGASTPPTAEELQVGRALVVLERVANAPSRRLLERLAGGDPDAWQTIAARLSLERLARRNTPGHGRD